MTENWSATHIIDWLLRHGRHFTDAERLLGDLCDRVVAAGLPIARVNVFIRTLHPQYFGVALAWEEGVTRSLPGRRSALQTDTYLKSPIRRIKDGERILRRKLIGEEAELDFPVLEELRDQGFTDYVMVELTFSGGERNGVSLATRDPSGFSTRDLDEVQRLLHIFALLMENHTHHQLASNLMRTYLGSLSGARVLQGKIQRGDGDRIDAVIWFSDLRNSTRLAETLAQDAFLDLLNEYFEATAGAVLEAGGEVLRFIGDASLAVFPVDENNPAARAMACQSALSAAKRAVARAKERNRTRAEAGLTPFNYGIGLHLGRVLYGNIGTEERLEFSVIGPAANLTARIEALSKTTGETIIVTKDVAAALRGAAATDLRSLGEHTLRGIEGCVEVFGV